ncbi:MAG: Trifunctional nucleotide phosphoesterase protein YfkN precursor [Syntrophorhabdus sp. PtaB.Bin047]|nr:MAG: Trifunctional nucleotide phosphoesterase protein YfkN precursor [Syntrophorhabdus sp. PtaB.Bin047]
MKRTKISTVVLLISFIIFLFTAHLAPACAASLRILHVNDFHGFAESHKRLGSDDLRGGAACLATLVETLRKEKPSLLLAAGDMVQGNTWSNLFEGKPVIEVMNAMRFDAMVVGNHEFDFGKTVLTERIREANFPVLGANVTGLDALRPYTVKVVDGIRVGIIGVVTEETPTATHPRNVDGLTFMPVAKTVERCIAELKDRADVIVVLSHLGYNADMALASTVKGIDVIVGGHSHTKGVKQITVGNTVIVQAWEHGLVLGVLDLNVESGRIVAANGRLEEIVPAKTGKDEKVAAIVEKWAAKVSESMEKVVAEAEVELDGENVRVRETNLGNFIADILKKESGADAAIINGGGLRTSIKKGPVTVGNIYSVLPFNNYIVGIRLTGKQIRDALEYGLSGIEQKEGRFPQVAGLTVTYSPGKEPGKRVGTILVGREPIDPSRQYIVATVDFLAAGGDGYQVFREAIRQSPDFEILGGTIKSGNLVYNDAGRWVRDVVVSEAGRQKKLTPAVEGRIQVEGAGNESTRK